LFVASRRPPDVGLLARRCPLITVARDTTRTPRGDFRLLAAHRH
jgi:hypothetical protein